MCNNNKKIALAKKHTKYIQIKAKIYRSLLKKVSNVFTKLNIPFF